MLHRTRQRHHRQRGATASRAARGVCRGRGVYSPATCRSTLKSPHLPIFQEGGTDLRSPHHSLLEHERSSGRRSRNWCGLDYPQTYPAVGLTIDRPHHPQHGRSSRRIASIPSLRRLLAQNTRHRRRGKGFQSRTRVPRAHRPDIADRRRVCDSQGRQARTPGAMIPARGLQGSWVHKACRVVQLWGPAGLWRPSDHSLATMTSGFHRPAL